MLNELGPAVPIGGYVVQNIIGVVVLCDVVGVGCRCFAVVC